MFLFLSDQVFELEVKMLMSLHEKIEFIQVEYFTLYNQYLEKCSEYDRLITRLLNQVRRLETVKDNLLDTSNAISSFHEILQTPTMENLLYVRDGLSNYGDSFYALHGGELVDYFLTLLSSVQMESA